LGTKVILVRSSWQTVNIGDIAHTPGLVALLQRHLPEAHVLLWPGGLDRGVDRMLGRHFPDLEILDPDDSPAVDAAIDRADLMLHGSGPGLVGAGALARWCQRTDKPFGVFGVTLGEIGNRERHLLERAAFVFTRETASLEPLAEAGISGESVRFVPDAVLALSIRDESGAQELMAEQGLEEGRFLCVVPRLRKTPYHRIYPGSRSPDWVRQATELNERTKRADHLKLVHTIIRYVRESAGKVLVCPEMTYQLDIMDELLLDPLPLDFRRHVRPMRRFWLPDEALSVYGRAAAVLSIECHSPLLAVAAGTPAFHVRQPEDGAKGQMYHDLGMSGCVFEIDQITAEGLAAAVMAGLSDGSAARAAANAKEAAARLHKRAWEVARETLETALV
jgi:polysaccharide pyruvyl transferase WcaK-like protein